MKNISTSEDITTQFQGVFKKFYASLKIYGLVKAVELLYSSVRL